MNAFAESATRALMAGSERTEANLDSLQRLASLPKNTLYTVATIDWFNAVQQFKAAEIDALCEPDPGEFLHRLILATFISQGERLVIGVKHHGLLPDAPFKLEDIQATIESLRETFRLAHGPHNHPKTNEQILAILQVA